MKYFFMILLVLIGFACSSQLIPQIFADDNYTEFIVDGHTITTNSNKVSDISLDWDSEALPEGTVTFSDPFTGLLEIQIPKNMPRTMNLNFETSLFLIVDDAVDGQHVFESENTLYDDRITETESECFYILSMSLENVKYFEIVTGSVAAGKWESVVIENEECNYMYDEPLSRNGSVFPHHGYHQSNIPPLKQFKSGISIHEIQCKETLLLIKKHDGSPACVKLESVTKLIERDWAKNEYYPFGIMGPIMTQQSCNDYVISQWQPTFEGKERVQQFLEICIQRGFVTSDLIERGKIANNFTHGPIQTAKRSAGGDIEKTIENLEEMYEEKTIENLDVHEEDIGKAIVHVDVDKEEYHAGDVVIISGYVERMMPDTELNITVRNPLMDVVLVSQVTISEDRTFTESLPIGGPLWEQNGIYSVSIQYGKTIDHTDFLYLSDLESDDLL